MYPVSQAADITAFKRYGTLLPVGARQKPIIEQNQRCEDFNRINNTDTLVIARSILS